MKRNLTNFIKYCLEYIKITRDRTIAAQQKYSVDILSEHFNLLGLLNNDINRSIGELINLDTFYSYDPNDVPDSKKERYEKEKELAKKIQYIYDKYRNDQFTKQIFLNFGYFQIEIPIESNKDTVDLENDTTEMTLFKETKIDRYPLFALPIKIEKEISSSGVGKYYVYLVDSEVQINIGILDSILGDDLYFQLLEEIGKYEIEGFLSLPITGLKNFKEIWHKIKAQLRLKEVNFDENSFSLEEIKITLGPKANYFLAEDLTKLGKLSEENLVGTALTSWVSNEGLDVENDIPHEKDLYFPFLYDKYQLSTLSLLGNKAAIIQGPPGTGKSETISNILCHLAATGNKVLFVSQKAQALKVVKDKLKQLGIKYLYGYLPNPNSAQISEEDEADGIAPQLSALGLYIQKIEHKFNFRKNLFESDINDKTSYIKQIVEERDKYKNSFNSVITMQRKYYQLYQKLMSLKDYDVNITDFDRFAKNFSFSEWQEIKSTKSEIEYLKKVIKEYEYSDEKNEFDKLFILLDLKGKNFSEAIGKLRDDLVKTGYDRHSNLLRKLNNFLRNIRLNEVRSKLPREIIDYIDYVLNLDLSRNEATKRLDSLYNYFYHYENIQRLEKVENKLNQKLTNCGLSNEEFNLIDSKINEIKLQEFEEVKGKILQVQKIKSDLNKLSKTESTNKISSFLKRIEQERKKRISLYIQNILNNRIIQKWKQSVRIRQIVAKLAKTFGKSKKAFKTFDNLRKDPSNFNAVLDLIPVWIMELDDASRIIPLEPAIFDYVILEEASQCNVAYTLPVMYRSKHALFVGDSEQMRDNTIIFKSNRVFDELARRYSIPEEMQIKSTGNAVQSVLDIANQRGFPYRQLLYHYRSPAELIGFSNKYFYKPKGKELIPVNSNYFTYLNTNRIMIVHEIKSDWGEEFSDSVNVAEAKAILKLFKELRSDKRYDDKSIGILSFFNAQASYIRQLFESEGFNEEKDNYKISIIEGIQGDQKDIVIYSFVIRSLDQKNKYVPLTGEGGDIRADINKGRVNVAFSRARLQVHCFISMSPQEIPEKIWIKKYIKYALENGEISFYSNEIKPFDSHFEEEFYNFLRMRLKSSYKIKNQVESCGFKIDFVVINVNSGKRIAIECDGPTHFKDEIDESYGIYVESDEERQTILERAGWKFIRIKYSDWVDEKFDRNIIVSVIENKLK